MGFAQTAEACCFFEAISRREVFLRSRLSECFSSSCSSCYRPRFSSSKLFSDTDFSSKNSEKSVSGRLGGTLPVGKNAFLEVLAARSLPRHVSESILRRCWDPSWGSKFCFYVNKTVLRGFQEGSGGVFKGCQKWPQGGRLLRSIFPRLLEHFRVQLGLQSASQHASYLKAA